MKDFIVAVRDCGTTYTYHHIEPSYQEAKLSIPPPWVDDKEYVIICPKGFVIPKQEVEAIKPSDLPF